MIFTRVHWLEYVDSKNSPALPKKYESPYQSTGVIKNPYVPLKSFWYTSNNNKEHDIAN